VSRKITKQDDHYELVERQKNREESYSTMEHTTEYAPTEGRNVNSGNNEAEPEDCLCCIRNLVTCLCCGGGVCGCAGTCDCVTKTGVCDCPEAMRQKPFAVDNPANPAHVMLGPKGGGGGPGTPVKSFSGGARDALKKDGVRRFDIGTELAEPEYMENGWLRADGFITRTGIFHYKQSDGSVQKEYRPPDEVFKADALRSFAMVPLTNLHPESGLLNAENTKLYQVGTVETPRKDGEKVRTRILVTDSEAVASAKRGRAFLSGGYTCDLDYEPGEINGERYDCVQRNIRGNHVALVDEGRAGPEVKLRVDTSDAAMVAFSSEKTPKGNTVTPRQENMRRIRIDGVEYEVSEQAAQAFDKEQRLASGEISKQKARADVAEAALKKANEKLAEAPAKFEADRQARKEAKKAARVIVGDDVSFEGKSVDEIKRMALEASGVKCDGKDATYVEAAFDVATANAARREDSVFRSDAPATKPIQGTHADGKTVESLDAARERMQARSRDAYKLKADAK
jgi:hypothetical protein